MLTTLHQADRQEVTSKAIQSARRATRLAEAEARQYKTERDRLARENANLSQRLEREIDTLEHSADPAFQSTIPPTPISTDFTTKNKKTRPADIITSFDNLDDPFDDGLVTGGMVTQLPKLDPNSLLDALGHPRSVYTPARAPIPIPEPPYPPFPPQTADGRRRSAERMINDPEREQKLAEERAYLAANRAVQHEFEENRSDKFALTYTLLRKRINLPVRNTMVRLDDVIEEEEKENGEKIEGRTEDEADDEEDEEDDSSDESLTDEEFNVSFFSKRSGW
jgi:hypothetical protein